MCARCGASIGQWRSGFFSIIVAGAEDCLRLSNLTCDGWPSLAVVKQVRLIIIMWVLAMDGSCTCTKQLCVVLSKQVHEQLKLPSLMQQWCVPGDDVEQLDDHSPSRRLPRSVQTPAKGPTAWQQDAAARTMNRTPKLHCGFSIQGYVETKDDALYIFARLRYPKPCRVFRNRREPSLG